MKIFAGRPVERDDEETLYLTGENQSDYSLYPLIILSRGERKQVARVTADKSGNYRIGLPPGDYILDVERRVEKRLRVKAQPFTIAPNATVRADMTIFVGLANE